MSFYLYPFFNMLNFVYCFFVTLSQSPIFKLCSYKRNHIYLLSPSVKAKIEKEIPPMKEVESVLNPGQQIQRLSSRDRNSPNKIEKGLQELILL